MLTLRPTSLSLPLLRRCLYACSFSPLLGFQNSLYLILFHSLCDLLLENPEELVQSVIKHVKAAWADRLADDRRISGGYTGPNQPHTARIVPRSALMCDR